MVTTELALNLRLPMVYIKESNLHIAHYEWGLFYVCTLKNSFFSLRFHLRFQHRSDFFLHLIFDFPSSRLAIISREATLSATNFALPPIISRLGLLDDSDPVACLE